MRAVAPVRVERDPAAPGGHALIRVDGATAAQTSPGFHLRRGEDWDDAALGPAGWQAREELLMPERASVDGSDLVLHVGPAVCNHVEVGVYTFDLPGAGLAGEAVHWPDIPSIHAGALDVLNLRDRPGPKVAGSTVVPPPPPPPPPPGGTGVQGVRSQPPIEVLPPVPGRPTGTAAAFLVVLLLLGSAYAYWWNYGRTTEPPPVAPAPIQAAPPVAAPPPPVTPAPQRPPAPPNPPPSPPSPPSMTGLSVPEVLARAPNPAAIAAEGLRRLQHGQPDDGLLLLEAAADRGDGNAAATLARLYDPLKFQPGGPIPTPDARQAARHYRDATARGIDVAADREALRRSLETKSRGGDMGATLALKDFWP